MLVWKLFGLNSILELKSYKLVQFTDLPINCNMNEHNNILSEITLQCNTHIDHNICLYGDFNVPKIDRSISCPLYNE